MPNAWAELVKDSFDVLRRFFRRTDEVVGAIDMCDSEAGTIASVPVTSVLGVAAWASIVCRNVILTIRDCYDSASPC